jgi:hypothetical protein
MERQKGGELVIVPVILKPCDWQSSPLQQFKAVPKDGRPICEWTNRDSAFLDVVMELRRLVTAKHDTRDQRAPTLEPTLPNVSVTNLNTADFDKPTSPDSPGSFRAWLDERLAETTIPNVQRKANGVIEIGGCTVLDTAKLESGYGAIVLAQQTQEPISDALTEDDRENWEKMRATLLERKVSGTSLQVRRFAPELSDDPHPRLEYQIVNYADARAFSAMLEGSPEKVVRYRDHALRVMGEGTNLPNILSTAVVTIVGKGAPELLVAHRKVRTGGSDGNCWGVSIGEQFNPVSGTRGGRRVMFDDSIEASVIRGLREELLGNNFAGSMRISTQAFVMENHVLAACRTDA